MKKYLFKALIAAAPILFVLIIYFINDPFKVLYHYDQYFNSKTTQYVNLSKDFVSTQHFINNYDKYKYDSYIFGSSRSMLYHVAEWKKHINGKSLYHFDGAEESLYGIEKKFLFLDRRSVKIKNALIIFDEELLSKIDNSTGLATIKHPALSGQSKLSFEMYYLKSFMDKEFLIPYLNLIFFNKFTPGGALLNARGGYIVASNEVSWTPIDSAIQNNMDSFYKAREFRLYKRSGIPKIDSVHLDSARISMLTNIKNILIKDSTDFRIVINPLYNQIKMNPADLEVLKKIFGSSNVFDFSGINEITNDVHNYYEEAHYRPFVSTRIMDSIYARHN